MTSRCDLKSLLFRSAMWTSKLQRDFVDTPGDSFEIVSDTFWTLVPDPLGDSLEDSLVGENQKGTAGRGREKKCHDNVRQPSRQFTTWSRQLATFYDNVRLFAPLT